jgi:hypothetical protein
MRALFLFIVALSLCVCAQATILTFTYDGVPWALVPQVYGDNVTSPLTPGMGSYLEGSGWTPNVTVAYRGLDWTTLAVAENNATWWSGGYGDLTNIAYFGNNTAALWGEIRLEAAAGYQVILNSFDLGAYGASRSGMSVRVLDESGAVLWSETSSTVPGTGLGHASYSPGLESTGGVLRIQYGDGTSAGTYLAAIDNVDFAQDVPEPAAALLILPALLATLYLRRRPA